MKDQVIQFVQRNLDSASDILRPKLYDEQKRLLPHRYAFLSIRKSIDDFQRGGRQRKWVLMPGLRGTGKTTILAQVYAYLIGSNKIPKKDILYLSVDEVVGLLKSNLYEVVSAFEEVIGTKLEKLDHNVFLLIDETHFDTDWALTLKNVYEKTSNVFILTTGSSALALHASPDVSRRVQVERVYPLRFIEYIVLKYGTLPNKGLAEEVALILYNSPDAKTVHDSLRGLLPRIASYWAKVDSLEIKKYLDSGSLPFALHLSKEDAYKRILEMLNNVIYKDLTFQSSFKNDTLRNFPGLLLMLASFEDVSIQKLADALKVNHETVIEMIAALQRCELIEAIPSYGAADKKLSKPPRYAFIAPMIKAAFLWNIGKFNQENSVYGRLLEDAAVLYFVRAKEMRRIIDISRRWGDGEADYSITTPDSKKIAFEFCFGEKSDEQVRQTIGATNAKYGILVGEGELALRENIVVIPKRIFFLM